MTEILCLLLRPALLCVSDPKRYWYLTPVAVLAWLLDVVLCHTFWAIAFGWPQGRERTISDTLERLCVDWDNPYCGLHIQLGQAINHLCPTGDHIKAAM